MFVSSCSDLSPTQLEVNDIYGRLIDTHKKAILCYRRILYNIKNRYENVSSAISLDTMYFILNDLCKQSGGVIFDQMNPLREKLLKLR